MLQKNEMNLLQPHVLAALKDCCAGKLAWTVPTEIIADCTWNAVECSCHKISYEKVEEGEEYFREHATSENLVVAVLFKYFLVSERIFSMAQINVTALTFWRPRGIQMALFKNIPLYSKFLPLWKHFFNHLVTLKKESGVELMVELLTFMVNLETLKLHEFPSEKQERR